MFRQRKIGRNNSCPCLSGKKFKHCCEGHVDWNDILSNGRNPNAHLSVRGRNQLFMDSVIDILKLDRGDEMDLDQYKSSFTAEAVSSIHQSIENLWPPDLDVSNALTHKSNEVSGLYVGDYSTNHLIRGVVRHSIYANKIILIDPFIYPRSVRKEFNPIINPNQHRSQTLKNVNLWLTLYPWVDAGIVEFIRTPADFDSELNWYAMTRQREKFDTNEILKKAAEKTVEDVSERHLQNMAYEMLLLGAPDSSLKSMFYSSKVENDGVSFDEFLKYVHILRKENPNVLGPIDQQDLGGQLHMFSTGANYEIAELTAGITNSYLVTDMRSRWAEIEFARSEANSESRVWSPMAKAVQEAPLKYLDFLGLKEAKQIRDEGRLESMRAFLHKLWKGARQGDDFDEGNARQLAEELGEEVRNAEREWKQIDNDLLKMVGAEAAAGLLASGPLIATGHGAFVGAAAVVAGASTLAVSRKKRKSFPDKFPAAFFMKIDS